MANVSLVPQQIHLLDSSIIENIGFGIDAGSVDLEIVDRAVKVAQLGDLVSQAQEGLERRVGEGGKNLSYGQKQRIGIARAIYRETDLLVLDLSTPRDYMY